MKKLSKRQKAIREKVELEKQYSLEEALQLLQEVKATKFDETVDVVLRLGVDPRKADQMVRGTCSLPHGLGREIRVLVFAKGEKAREAEEAGADYVGAEDIAERIQKESWFDYERVVATPDVMNVVGRLGKILGPRGLMPNPKLGTVTPDVKKAVEDAKGGQIEFRAEKTGIVHAGVGKASFSEEALAENVKTFVDAIAKAKPTGVKGTYMKRVSVSSSMGPGLKLSIAD